MSSYLGSMARAWWLAGMILLPGCGLGAGYPRLLQTNVRNGWVVVDRLNVLDAATRTTRSLAPWLRGVVGEDVWPGLSGTKWRERYVRFSTDGRWLACEYVDIHDRRVYIIDIEHRTVAAVPTPQAYELFEMAWSPDSQSLVIYLLPWHSQEPVGGIVGEGLLAVATINDGQWRLRELSECSRVRFGHGNYQQVITARAWDSNDGFLFADDGEIKRCDLTTRTVAPVCAGSQVWCFREGEYLVEDSEDPGALADLRAMQYLTRQADGSLLARQIESLTGVDCVSPDGRYALAVGEDTVSIWGEAGFHSTAWWLDLASGERRMLLDGYYWHEAVCAIAWSDWINDPYHLYDLAAEPGGGRR